VVDAARLRPRLGADPDRRAGRLAGPRPAGLTAAELRPPTTFTPHLQARLRLTASDVKQLLDSPNVQLLDARAPSEFAGHAGSTRRLGHIPGALNVPAAATTEPRTGRFRSAEEMRALLRRPASTRAGA
jgi:3-mercaptopyruvate sulfurtransferase SseA